MWYPLNCIIRLQNMKCILLLYETHEPNQKCQMNRIIDLMGIGVICHVVVAHSLWQFSVIGVCDRNTYHTQLFDKNLEFWFQLCLQFMFFFSYMLLCLWFLVYPQSVCYFTTNCVFRWTDILFERIESIRASYVMVVYFLLSGHRPKHTQTNACMHAMEAKIFNSSNNNTYRNNLMSHFIELMYSMRTFFFCRHYKITGSSFPHQIFRFFPHSIHFPSTDVHILSKIFLCSVFHRDVDKKKTRKSYHLKHVTLIFATFVAISFGNLLSQQ